MFRLAILGSGLAVLLAAFLIVHLRTSAGRVTKKLASLSHGVTAALTPEIESWLRPQLERRDRWIGGMSLVGIGLGSATSSLLGAPWYWLVVALSTNVSYMAGTFIAAFGNFPRPAGSQRTASVEPRRLRDFLRLEEGVCLILAIPVTGLAFAASVTVFFRESHGVGTLALGLCGLSVIVVVTSLVLARLLVARPMVSMTPEGRLWQEAMLADTVQPVPRQALLVGALSVASAAVAMAQAWDRMPLVSLVTGVALLALCVACTVAAVITYVTEKSNEVRAAPQAADYRRW